MCQVLFLTLSHRAQCIRCHTDSYFMLPELWGLLAEMICYLQRKLYLCSSTDSTKQQKLFIVVETLKHVILLNEIMAFQLAAGLPSCLACDSCGEQDINTLHTHRIKQYFFSPECF